MNVNMYWELQNLIKIRFLKDEAFYPKSISEGSKMVGIVMEKYNEKHKNLRSKVSSTGLQIQPKA